MTLAVLSTTAAPGTGSLTRVPFGIVTVYCGERAGLDSCLISRFVYPYCVMFIPLSLQRSSIVQRGPPISSLRIGSFSAQPVQLGSRAFDILIARLELCDEDVRLGGVNRRAYIG